MGVYYITNLCKGTFGDIKVSTIVKKVKLSGDKMIEQHEWDREFVDLNDLKQVCIKNEIDISEFLDGKDGDDLFLEEAGTSTMDVEACNWSTFIRVKDCFCNDQTKTRLTTCVICYKVNDIVMSDYERECVCCQKITAICGLPEYVCDDCEEKGWYSTAGCGGGTQHCNSKTGVKIYK